MRKHNRQVTLRIPEDILQQIIKASASLNESKSRFIKRSIIAYLDYHFRLPLAHSHDTTPHRSRKYK